MSDTPDLDELERLERMAEPTPWTVVLRETEALVRYPSREDVSVLDTANAALIAALRNAAPWLIARARRAEELEAKVDLAADLADDEYMGDS